MLWESRTKKLLLLGSFAYTKTASKKLQISLGVAFTPRCHITFESIVPNLGLLLQ